MKVVFIQDQEIYAYNGRYYHSKSKNYFKKFMPDYSSDYEYVILCGIIDIKDNEIIQRYKEITDNNIRYVKLPDFRVVSEYKKMIEIIKKEIQDAQMCYLRVGVASSFASFFCKKRKVKYVAILCEDVFKNTKVHRSKVVRILSFPLWIATRNMVYNANYAYYVTKNYLQKKYPCKGSTLGCSDVEELMCAESDYLNRIDKINKMDNNIIIGSVGAVSVYLKGHDIAIKAIGELKKKGYLNYKLQIIGTGNPDKLKKLAKRLNVEDSVSFLGEKSRDYVCKWMEEIDIYLHPSRSEGLPRTILEAMAKGTPCICTKVGGVPELIDKKWLFLPNKKDSSKVLSEMILAMGREEMIIEAGKNFTKAKEYTQDNLEPEISAFFNNVLNDLKEG